MPEIPGYLLDGRDPAPVGLADLALMQQAALFGDDDVRWLRRSGDILADQIEAVLDVWYGFIGSTPQLVSTFAPVGGAPSGPYLAAVRVRFAQWIRDTTAARFDQAWLDTQLEIGLRHHRLKKNRTDGVDAAPIVPFRYLAPLAVPVVTTLRPFLAARGHAAEDVDRMLAAWMKSVLLQVTLWSHPYVKPGDF